MGHNRNLAGSAATANIHGFIANTQITGLITSNQIATVANTQITGLITGAQIASGVIPAGGFSSMQTFTSSGTFTVPAGKTTVKVTVIGGGGNGDPGGQSFTGGEPGSYISYPGAGGASGGAAIEYLTGLTPGATVSVTVGGAGGTSSFGAFCSATGAGGVGSGGQINITGGPSTGGVTGGGAPSILGSYGAGGGGGSGGDGATPGLAGVVMVEF